MPDQSSAATEHALLQEITAPLETLPDDPLAIVEAEFPIAMRGYDRHAVDDYVEQVSRLVAELHATRSPESAVRRALERVGDQISGILQRAHETAEQITTQSRVEAEDRLEQARREAATMIDAAAQRVRELDADADRIWAERQRIIADAEDLSGQLQAVAHDAAARFPAEDVRGTPVDADSLPAPVVGEPPSETGESGQPEWPEEREETVAPEWPQEHEVPQEREVPQEPEEHEVPEESAEPDLDDDEALELAGEADPEGPEEIEQTRRFEPPPRLTDDDSTQIIPPASDAAQHRRDT